MKNDVWCAPRSNDARDILKSQEISACRKRKEKNLDELSEQICQKQSLDGITCSRENKYTSELLFQAIKNSLAKAQR